MKFHELLCEILWKFQSWSTSNIHIPQVNPIHQFSPFHQSQLHHKTTTSPKTSGWQPLSHLPHSQWSSELQSSLESESPWSASLYHHCETSLIHLLSLVSVLGLSLATSVGLCVREIERGIKKLLKIFFSVIELFMYSTNWSLLSLSGMGGYRQTVSLSIFVRREHSAYRRLRGSSRPGPPPFCLYKHPINTSAAEGSSNHRPRQQWSLPTSAKRTSSSLSENTVGVSVTLFFLLPNQHSGFACNHL